MSSTISPSSTETDTRHLDRSLSTWLRKERALVPVLARLGAQASDLQVLRGDQQLLEILAEDFRNSDKTTHTQLDRLLACHESRLERITTQLLKKRHFKMNIAEINAFDQMLLGVSRLRIRLTTEIRR